MKRKLMAFTLIAISFLFNGLSIFAANAMPTAKDRPCPSEPVNASTPGTLDSEWAPRRLPRRQKDRSSDTGKNPISARTGYKAKQPCPLLRMNLSRSSQSWLLGSTRRTPPL